MDPKIILMPVIFLCALCLPTGQPEEVVANVSDDVTLPCKRDGPLKKTGLKVTWRWGAKNVVVHEFRSGKDYLRKQDDQYKRGTEQSRTSLFAHEMEDGNLSLKLVNVAKKDEGNYSCCVVTGENSKQTSVVNLVVREKHPSAVSGTPSTYLVGLGFLAVIVLGAIIAIIIFTIHRRNKRAGQMENSQSQLHLMKTAKN